MRYHLQMWFQKLLPPTSARETTEQRERHRKAELLALIVVAVIALSCLPVVSYALFGPQAEELLLGPGISVAVGILWLNRKGYFEIAAWAFLFLVLMATLSFTFAAPVGNIGDLWIFFLTMPALLAGSLLPAWSPWIFGVIDCIIFTVVWQALQMHMKSKLPPVPVIIDVSFYFLFLLVALIGSLYSWNTSRAVRQADRALELEVLNQHLQDANTELQMLQEELSENNTALKAANARLEALATTDPLTDLPNHRSLALLLEREITAARRRGRQFALLFCDIDHFKAINDTYGHNNGDIILRQFAQAVRDIIRSADVIGRWGGEEFLILLPEIADEAALQVAEQICVSVASRVFPVADDFHLTCSIGVACYPHAGT
ncbi:MAG TPA: GGDEF domain-containing protein, partial [Ktedonobacterales bacterium]|nr:GGDEF domain-containing protein [Ktedonobacterales bacterium]